MKPFLTSTTVVAVACFATATTAAPMCAELLLVDQLESKYQRLAPIHSDTATGWIFTNDQMSEDYTLKSEARHLMAEIVHEFDRRGIELALLIAPPRPLVAGEEVVRETLGANGDFDAVAATESYEKMMAQLAETGAVVPNLLPTAQELTVTQPYYFQRDTHWTPAGAAISALEMAAALGAAGPEFVLSDVASSDTYEEGGSLSSIVASICGIENDGEQVATMDYSSVMDARGLGLLDDVSDDTLALIGTSFSDRNKRDQYQVADALAAATGAEVFNYSVSGGGMIGPMEAFVLSGDLDSAGHSTVIWEFPYTQSPNATSQLRQLLGALRASSAGLSKPVPLALSTSNEAVLDFAGQPLETDLIRIVVDTTALFRLDLVVAFESGKTKTIKLRRKNRIPEERRTMDWFADLRGWDHGGITEITAKFERDVDLNDVSFSYQIGGGGF